MTLPALKSQPDELERLRELLSLAEQADALVESCVRERLSLRATLDRVLPPLLERLGACGAVAVTRDEELTEAAFSAGDLGGADPWVLLEGRSAGVHRSGDLFLVVHPLDVAGAEVGRTGFLFRGEPPGDDGHLRACVRAVCEQLDAVLATVHTAGLKQQLIEQVHRALSGRVFESGLDQAVSLLHATVPLQRFVFVWRDAVDDGAISYRLYRDGALEFDSEAHKHPGLEAAVRAHGVELLSPERNRLRAALGFTGGLEHLLVTGERKADWLGKALVVPGPGGFSTFALDLVRLLAEMTRERLVDYNRERRHLAQFFAPPVINALLREPAYQEKYLAPREERVAILYADINSFTRLSELVLERPSVIGEFVDRWSEGVVDILWRHGGTFDKMVGDCVIGLFGPPFYRDAAPDRALAAARAALEMQAFTVRFGEGALESALHRRPELSRGLGIAVGVNLCSACVGTFGPNHDVTAFSAGMNATARLQSLAGFREILVMEPAVEALKSHPEASGLSFGPMAEASVKNVLKPLRYARLDGPAGN